MLCSPFPPSAPPPASRWSRAVGCGLRGWCEAEACDSCARLPGWGLTHTASQGLRSRAAPPQLPATHTGPNCLQCCPWTCSPMGTGTGSAHCSMDVSVLCPGQAESFGLPVLYALCVELLGTGGKVSAWWVCSKHDLPPWEAEFAVTAGCAFLRPPFRCWGLSRQLQAPAV